MKAKVGRAWRGRQLFPRRVREAKRTTVSQTRSERAPVSEVPPAARRSPALGHALLVRQFLTSTLQSNSCGGARGPAVRHRAATDPGVWAQGWDRTVEGRRRVGELHRCADRMWGKIPFEAGEDGNIPFFDVVEPPPCG